MTTADLKASGTHPSMSEQLASFVSDGSSMSMHSLIRNVSQGSNRHDHVGEILIILSIASLETCLKTVIFGGSKGGSILYSVPVGVKVSLIFLILLEKNETNWSSNDLSDSLDGSVTSVTLFRVLCSSCHSFRES